MITQLEQYILIGPASDCILAFVRSVMLVDGVCYVWAQELPDAIETEPEGALFAVLTPAVLSSPVFRLIRVYDGMITALWDYPDYQQPMKRRFIVKW